MLFNLIDDWLEWIIGGLFTLCLLGMFSVIFGFDTQSILYDECLLSDYDKFQCYSMIYGSK